MQFANQTISLKGQQHWAECEVLRWCSAQGIFSVCRAVPLCYDCSFGPPPVNVFDKLGRDSSMCCSGNNLPHHKDDASLLYYNTKQQGISHLPNGT